MSGECNTCGHHTLECICLAVRRYYPLIHMKPEQQQIEEVNSPRHYQGNSLEAIDVIEDFELNFHLGNAVKYILRAGKKSNKTKDLKKAIWYLERELTNEDQ